MYDKIINIFSSVWMIDKSVVNAHIPLFLRFIKGENFNFQDNKTYLEEQTENILQINNSLNIPITTDYYNEELEDQSVAIHPVKGIIMAESYYGFSTKDFVNNLLAAENNPGIFSHVLAVNTGGGMAHYLDVAASTIKKLKKPVLVHFEQNLASAGYYIAASADKIYANSKFDRAGSIGTMVSMVDFVPLLEQFGAKEIEAYATLSTLKNKVENDLLDGKPEDYIKEVLDPLNEGFIQSVKSGRPGVESVNESEGVLNGRMFYAEQAIKNKMVDGIKSINQVISEAYEFGLTQKNMQSFVY